MDEMSSGALRDYIADTLRLKLIGGKLDGTKYDKDEIKKHVENILKSLNSPSNYEVEILQESDEEKLLRKILDEPNDTVTIRYKYNLHTNVQYINLNYDIFYDKK